jgi:hypothetical protein
MVLSFDQGVCGIKLKWVASVGVEVPLNLIGYGLFLSLPHVVILYVFSPHFG